MRTLVATKIVVITIAAMLIIAPSAFAKTLTFTKEYTYQASEADSKLSCRTLALDQVKRLLLEEIGTYLEAQTEVKNYQLTKDEVTVLTAGIVSSEVKEEKWDGKSYWLKAQIVADPEDVAKALDNLRKDHEKVQELEEARGKADAASKEIEKLRKEISMLKGQADNQQMKKYDEAVNKLTANDWFEKGRVLNNAKKYDDAIDAFNKAIEIDPKNADFYFYRGGNYYDMKNFEQAILDAGKAIELDPKSFSGYGLRGLANRAMGNYGKAILDFDKIIKSDSNKHYSKAIAAIKRVIAYVHRGKTYAAMGQSAAAIKDYDKAIELNSNNAEAYLERGIIYLQLGYHKAQKEFDAAKDKMSDQERDSLLERMAKGDPIRLPLAKSSDCQRGIHDLDKAIDLNSTFKSAYMERGSAYINLGEYQQGINDYNRVITIDPQNVGAYLFRANAYSKIGNSKQAVKDYDKAVEINPKDARVYFSRGMHYYEHVNDEQAEEQSFKDLEKATELDPQNALYYLMLGNHYMLYSMRENDPQKREEAIAALKISARLGNNDAQKLLKDENIDW